MTRKQDKSRIYSLANKIKYSCFCNLLLVKLNTNHFDNHFNDFSFTKQFLKTLKVGSFVK